VRKLELVELVGKSEKFRFIWWRRTWWCSGIKERVFGEVEGRGAKEGRCFYDLVPVGPGGGEKMPRQVTWDCFSQGNSTGRRLHSIGTPERTSSYKSSIECFIFRLIMQFERRDIMPFP
jgi:hypothetical protein